MNYRLLPHSEFQYLRDLVYDVYELTNSDSELEYSTAPNGIIGISIIIEGDSQILQQNTWHESPEISVYGLVKKPDVIRISRNFREIAIGFSPYFFQMLTKENMSNVASEGNLRACELFNPFELQKLFEKIALATTDFQILDAIEQFVLKHLITSKVNDRLLVALRSIYEEGIFNVSEIGKKLNLSPTSVRSLFRERVGRSPKEVMTMVRINRILKSAPNTFSSLTERGYEFGYFDQAHFTHDFSKTIGMTPSHYFKDKNLAFDFYNYGRWQGNIFDHS